MHGCQGLIGRAGERECCLLFALALLDRPRSNAELYLGILCLVIASLIRYEGWILAVVFTAERLWGARHNGMRAAMMRSDSYISCMRT